MISRCLECQQRPDSTLPPPPQPNQVKSALSRASTLTLFPNRQALDIVTGRNIDGLPRNVVARLRRQVGNHVGDIFHGDHAA